MLVCAKQDIAEDKIPFDLKHHGFADYDSFDVDHPEAAINAFVDQLRSRRLLEKAKEETPDSPVSTFLRSRLIYCVNKALAWRRKVIGMLDDALLASSSVEAALKIVDGLNHHLNLRDIELTIVKDDKVLRHNPKVRVGRPAIECWFDMTRAREVVGPNGTLSLEHTPLYPEMKASGCGLRLGSISGYPGRITAIAFEQMSSQEWLVVVEAHVNQSQLST